MIHCALLIGLVAHSSQEAGSQGNPEEPLGYVRVYADSLGESHFADSEIPLELKDFAPPAAPLSVSSAQAASEVLFLSLPEGWFGDWHPAPRRQYLISLSGEVEIEVSDGERESFLPARSSCSRTPVVKGTSFAWSGRKRSGLWPFLWRTSPPATGQASSGTAPVGGREL